MTQCSFSSQLVLSNNQNICWQGQADIRYVTLSPLTCMSQCSSVGITWCQVFSHHTLCGLCDPLWCRSVNSAGIGAPGDSTICNTSRANYKKIQTGYQIFLVGISIKVGTGAVCQNIMTKEKNM